MREGPFVGWILDTARTFGWRCYHVPAPMRAVRGGGFVGAKEAAGLCDLILLHDDPPRLILAEVKGTGGTLSDEQREFLVLAKRVADTIGSVYVDACYERTLNPVGVYVWHPGHEDAIESVLRSKVLA